VFEEFDVAARLLDTVVERVGGSLEALAIRFVEEVGELEALVERPYPGRLGPGMPTDHREERRDRAVEGPTGADGLLQRVVGFIIQRLASLIKGQSLTEAGQRVVRIVRVV